jgi:hypothetical protein
MIGYATVAIAKLFLPCIDKLHLRLATPPRLRLGGQWCFGEWQRTPNEQHAICYDLEASNILR